MFNLKSAFKAPEGAIMVGLGEAAAVYVIYQSALPTHTDIRSAQPYNNDVEASRKRAAWKAAAVLGLVFLITQDLNSFLIGGLALGGVDLMVKHANAVSPDTGRIAGGAASNVPGPSNDVAFPMPDYGDTNGNDLGY